MENTEGSNNSSVVMAKSWDPFPCFYNMPPKANQNQPNTRNNFAKVMIVAPSKASIIQGGLLDWTLWRVSHCTGPKRWAQALVWLLDTGDVFILCSHQNKTCWSGSLGPHGRQDATRAVVRGRQGWPALSCVPLSCLITLCHKSQRILIAPFIFP